jgi:hypothetical protein
VFHFHGAFSFGGKRLGGNRQCTAHTYRKVLKNSTLPPGLDHPDRVD